MGRAGRVARTSPVKTPTWESPFAAQITEPSLLRGPADLRRTEVLRIHFHGQAGLQKGTDSAMNPDACCQLSVNQALSAKGQLPAGEAADTSGSGFQSGCCGHHPEPQVPHLFRPAAGSSPSPPDKIGGLCSSWPPATGSHTPPSRPTETRTP